MSGWSWNRCAIHIGNRRVWRAVSVRWCCSFRTRPGWITVLIRRRRGWDGATTTRRRTRPSATGCSCTACLPSSRGRMGWRSDRACLGDAVRTRWRAAARRPAEAQPASAKSGSREHALDPGGAAGGQVTSIVALHSRGGSRERHLRTV